MSNVVLTFSCPSLSATKVAENPTVGILLCQDKNDSLVELTLPEDANIYAAKYKLYLPDKKLLQEKLRQWLEEEGDI